MKNEPPDKSAPEQNVVLHEDSISSSRFHAKIRHENGGYTLYDQQSKSGAFVNNQRPGKIWGNPRLT